MNLIKRIKNLSLLSISIVMIIVSSCSEDIKSPGINDPVSSINLNSGVEHSSSSTDQLVQGPCYLFATLAALESMSLIQDPNTPSDIDLYEWNVYSQEVIGGHKADDMIPLILDHAENHGVYERGSLWQPTKVEELPSTDWRDQTGIAFFEDSENCDGNGASCDCDLKISDDDADFSTHSYEYTDQDGPHPCQDKPWQQNDPPRKLWKPLKLEGNKIYFEPSSGSNGYIVDSTPTLNEIKSHINNGEGVIVIVNNWTDSGDNSKIQHAVFVHGYSGNNLRFKNSWPEEAGVNQSRSFNFSGDINTTLNRVVKTYVLKGTVEYSNGITPSCGNYVVSGASNLGCTETYSVDLPAGASINSWNLSPGLQVLSQSGNSATIGLQQLAPTSGTISVTYTIQGIECTTAVKSISVYRTTSIPDAIHVNSQNWNNGQTCPNTTLELTVNDTSNPGAPFTEYNWSIAGAALISGQGGPSVTVRTPNSNQNVNLTFRVRARNGNCPNYSSWRTLTGISSPNTSGCSGGGLGL